MDNPLTPNKIQRLLHLAEGSTFSAPRRVLLNDEDLNRHGPPPGQKTSTCESSSGVLDLDQIQGFGESDVGTLSMISKTTGFNPGEMTGRSTGADDIIPKFRHSMNIDSLANELNRQTNEVHDIMRHSIATNYSFHSKRDLTADEASFVAREAPIPVQLTHTNIQDTSIVNNSDMSVGAYFKNRCPDFGKILVQTDSPDRSMMPSITEVSTHTEATESHQFYKLDPSLDSIPVRQPRNPTSDLLLGQQAANKSINTLVQPLNLPVKRELAESFKTPAKYVPKTDLHKSVKASMGTPAERKVGPVGKGATDLFMKAVRQSSIKAVSEETEGSMADNSLSISKIAEFLGNQSIVRVSDIISQLSKKDQKQPLSELNPAPNNEVQVTYLKDTRNIDTATSTGSVETVVPVDKINANQENKFAPEVVVTRYSLTKEDVKNVEIQSVKTEKTRSKSPSSKTRSTLSTVQENYGVESPPHFNKEKWAEFSITPVSGFVGVSCTASVTVTTITDSWLTASIHFDSLPNDIRIDLPRQPILLSPRKSENLILHLTSTMEMEANLSFTISLKDSSIDSEIEQKGTLEVTFKMPAVQAMSTDAINKVNFPPTLENTFLTKTFVLISDSPVDLQLCLYIVGGNELFTIKNVQEIKKCDVTKVLKETQGVVDERQSSAKLKNKALCKQLCRLTCGNAIRATVTFNAPNSLKCQKSFDSYKDVLRVDLIDVKATLKEVELTALVGVANLTFNIPENKLSLTKELKTIHITNTGTVSGAWYVRVKGVEERNPFAVSAAKIELAPGESTPFSMRYNGPDDVTSTANIIFEEITNGSKTILEVTSAVEKPTVFPIKTNCNTMSWVRSGRKEISLKNSSDKKFHVRCQIVGEGFSIDQPGIDVRGSCVIPFNPFECRPLTIVYAPTTHMPSVATLHLMYDKNCEFSRSINLHGCSSGDPVRWRGLATYVETALVRAVARAPIDLMLNNKSPMPSFVCARVNFNLQYISVASSSRVLGDRKVIQGRSSHTISLRVDWARVERRAQDGCSTTLATVTVLTGPEITRHRILRILKKESKGGELDTSLLPDNLKMLVDPFDGEDPNMESFLKDFRETKASLVELIGGLKELNAQIDLPQDFTEENTVLISDDTVLEHHTLYE